MDITRKDFLGFNFNKVAITAPVQAPVVGMGIATKKNNPTRLYFFYYARFLHRSSFNPAYCTIEQMCFFSKNSITGCNSLNKIPRAKIFPLILIKLLYIGFNPKDMPNGIAPRNSNIGVMEKK